jgi:diguanylate cyclase (GGDEF)-like protein
VENTEKKINRYLSILLPLGVPVLVWAMYLFPVEKLSTGMVALSAVTIFFSSSLRIQLPRTKIHLTVSDALITLSLLIYGGEVSVILAALESCFTSYHLRRKGVVIKTQTIFLNVSVAILSVFAASLAVSFFFGSAESVIASGNNTAFTALVLTIVLSQFTVNSVSVALFIAFKTNQTIWRVWNEYCVNALVMYLCGALVAGLSAKAIEQINVLLFAVVVAFFALVYITYRRYADDVKDTAAMAEQVERERAEQAENHIIELQHHIAEQDRIGQALRESKERFRHAAFHDALTDLPNRNQFMDVLRFALEKNKTTPGYEFGVLFLDLDRFKTINDSMGHSTGDQLIRLVAERLSNSIAEGDLVARFSGDEFAILVHDVRNADEVLNFAELIKHKISTPFSIAGRGIFVHVSIGIAVSSHAYEEAEDILRDADIAMYYAKERGQDYVVFDKIMHTRAVTLMQLETDLRYAIERNELVAYYQPIIDLNTMSLGGFESLIRWNHPQRGLVPPNEFIPVSEETDLIVPITLWMLRESCSQLVRWQAQDPSNASLMISVNLSGKHFAHNDMVEQIQKIITETGIRPSSLKLELTESAVMENAERVISMLWDLKGLGVQLSIDDFGTGYSSLSYLHRFPIDTLKVDRSFVGTMEDGTENGEIVRTIVALAKALGMNVVAEGIESIHQLHQLRILGCEYGQGFLFSRPVPQIEAEKIIDDKFRWRGILPAQQLNAPVEREYSHLRLAN